MADIAQTAANVLASSTASTTEGIAGEAITAGQPVYKDSSTGKLLLADANVLAKINVIGIALHGAALNQPLKYVTKDAQLTLGGTIAAGDMIILSATPGGICPVADLASSSYLVTLGGGIGSNKINFLPQVCGLKA